MTHLINALDPLAVMVAFDAAAIVVLAFLVVLARLYTVRRDRAEGDA